MQRLLTATLLIAGTLTAPTAVISAGTCSLVGAFDAQVCGSTDGESVDLSGTQDWGSGGDGGSDGGGSGWSASDESGGGSVGDGGASVCTETWDVRCFGGIIGSGGGDEPGGGSAPAPPTSVSASELASIAPNNATIKMEPNGWSLLNKPTNFWVTASSQTKSGTLLGHPITVTFTPSHVDWDYGDGDGGTATSSTVGASWETLGLPNFSTTQTSHTYTERGTYTVTATIHYSAVVSVAGRTIDVDGYVSTSSTLVGFELFVVDPVLVHP